MFPSESSEWVQKGTITATRLLASKVVTSEQPFSHLSFWLPRDFRFYSQGALATMGRGGGAGFFLTPEGIGSATLTPTFTLTPTPFFILGPDARGHRPLGGSSRPTGAAGGRGGGGRQGTCESGIGGGAGPGRRTVPDPPPFPLPSPLPPSCFWRKKYKGRA